MKYKMLVAYPAHVVRLNVPAKRRTYLMYHGYTLSRFFLVGSAEVKTEDIEGGANMDVSQ